MTRLRKAALVAAAAFACSAPLLAEAPAVAASSAAPASVPFTDPNVRGSITLCDKSGNEVRSGSNASAPFVWMSVSSAAAPAGYSAPTGRATLYAYQPIKDVDPGNWSGKQLTGSSTFTNSAHPMTSGTVLDSAIGDFVGAYPPQWDGLVQLRMAFSAPGKAAFSDSYPAAVVKITGRTWTLVQGGGGSCRAGSATSTELRALPSAAFAHALRETPPADVKHPGKAGAVPSSSASASTSAPTGSPGTATSIAPSAAAYKSSTHGSSPWIWIVVALGGAGAIAGGAYAYLRRRPAGI